MVHAIVYRRAGTLFAKHSSLSGRLRRMKVKVTNKENGHSATITITDRGPYVKGRCIDVTKAGARALGFAGLARVSVGMTD
jgi:rare lipoprotein A